MSAWYTESKRQQTLSTATYYHLCLQVFSILNSPPHAPCLHETQSWWYHSLDQNFISHHYNQNMGHSLKVEVQGTLSFVS